MVQRFIFYLLFLILMYIIFDINNGSELIFVLFVILMFEIYFLYYNRNKPNDFLDRKSLQSPIYNLDVLFVLLMTIETS